MRCICILSLLALLCASCSTSAIPSTPTFTSEPSPKSNPIIPAETQTATPFKNLTETANKILTATADWAQFQATLAALKTDTVYRSTLAAGIPTIKADDGVQPTTIILPTRSVIATPNPAAFDLLKEGGAHNISDDGFWIWETSYPLHTTHIIRSDGNVEWTVTMPQEYIGDVIGNGNRLVDAAYIPSFNLPDQSYYYLVGYVCCGMALPMQSDHSGNTMARLNLRSGKLSMIVTETGMNNFYFSPLEKYFLYFSAALNFKNMNILHFVRLSDGQKTDIPLPPGPIYGGGIGWSPDDNQALVQSCKFEPVGNRMCNPRSIYRVNIEQKEFKLVVSDLEATIGQTLDVIDSSAVLLEWTSANQARILVRNEYTGNYKEWVIDISTGAVVGK